MSYKVKYSIKNRYQALSLEPRAEQVGEFEGHAIQVGVVYDLGEDRYIVDACVTSKDGIRMKLQTTNLRTDEIHDAFQIGWEAVDSHFLHRLVGGL
jgi:hypothetical protein